MTAPTLEWSVPIGSVLLWAAQTAIVGLVAFFAFQRAIDKKFAENDVHRAELSGELHRMNDHLASIDSWIEALRKRTHEVMDKFQELFIKVDRLEQRDRHVRHTDIKP